MEMEEEEEWAVDAEGKGGGMEVMIVEGMEEEVVMGVEAVEEVNNMDYEGIYTHLATYYEALTKEQGLQERTISHFIVSVKQPGAVKYQYPFFL